MGPVVSCEVHGVDACRHCGVPPGERPQDWPQRLDAALKVARTRGYHARDWNCARFAHTCAQSIAGRDLAYRWRGSLEDSVDAVLPRLTDARRARIGDVVLASVPEPSLGVCLGRCAVFVTKRGLLKLPMSSVSIVWAV